MILLLLLIGHDVEENPSFSGLSYDTAGQTSSYFHFRSPHGAQQQASLAKPGIVRSGDFMGLKSY